MPLFLFIFIFYHIHTFIQSQYIHPSPFAEASLHFFIALSAQWGKPPCGAEPRIELGPALQQADALPTEPRRTINWATPHHCQLSHAAPFANWATPHHANWATPHHNANWATSHHSQLSHAAPLYNERFLSYLTFYPPKKVVPPLIKVEKKFLP
jgi:hypothetical protein